MSSGPGSILAQWLMKFNIRYEEPGCNCYYTMKEMNRAGPDKILKNMDYWVNLVEESSKHWCRNQKDSYGRLKCVAVKIAGREGIELAIRRACEKSLECQQPLNAK